MNPALPVLFSFSLIGAGNGVAHDQEEMAEPPLSVRPNDEARSAGVDVTRIDFHPGVHIVPLSESWTTEEQARITRQQIDQQRSKGYYDASPGDIMDAQAEAAMATARPGAPVVPHDRSFASLDHIEPLLAVKPAQLGASALSSVTASDVRIAGGYVDGKWTGLTRTFDLPDLGTVVLNETDHVAGNESVSLVEEWLNTTIKGHRGTVKTARDQKGRTTVIVGWIDKRKIYSLRLQPIRPEQTELNQARLLELARQIGDT